MRTESHLTLFGLAGTVNVGTSQGATRSIAIWERTKKNMKNFVKQKMRHELCKLPSGRLSGTRRIYINHLLEWLQRHAYVRKCLKYDKKKRKKRREEKRGEEGSREGWNEGKCLSCWRQVTLCSWFIILACVENITQMIYNPYLRALIMCVLSGKGEGGAASPS